MQQNINAFNQQIIEEFHTNEGKVGGPFQNSTLLLLTTTGAKSGQQRVNPLGYLAENGRIFIFASKAGADSNPDWYYNLLANPQVTVEIETEKFMARAIPIEGEERALIYARQAARVPVFAGYQEKTTRPIPVIELIRED